ncbi:MAG: aldo/keto reductase [Dehalococcoidia bacterium]
MQYRRLGRSEFMTAEVGIGTRGLAAVDPAEATATLEAALGLGVTLVEVDIEDTAALDLVAPVIASVRVQLLLVAAGDGDEDAARAALERLGVERFDAYLVRGPHPDLGAGQALGLAGLTRTVGLTTDSPEQALAAVLDGGIDLVQVPFDPLDRTRLQGVDAVLNAAQAADIAVVTCSPLAGGRLAAGASAEERAALAFLEDGPPRSMEQGLIAWALSEPRVAAVVCGPRTPAEATDCAGASSVAPLDFDTIEAVMRALQTQPD